MAMAMGMAMGTGMGTQMKKSRQLVHNTFALALGFSVSWPVAFSAEINLTPRTNLGVTYTDNVELASSNEENSAIGTLAAGVVGSVTGTHSLLNIDYLGTQAFYSYDSDRNDFYNELSLGLNNVYGHSGFSSNVTARVNNRATDSQRNASNNFLVADTVETRNANANLAYSNGGRGVIGLSANLETGISDSQDSEGNSHNYSAGLSINQGVRVKNYFWSFDYDYSKNDSRNSSNETESHELDGELGLMEKNGFVPLIKFSGEKYEQSAGSSDELLGDDKYAEAGPAVRYYFDRVSYVELSYLSVLEGDQSDYVGGIVNYQPTRRTTVRFEYGKRAFGDSYDFTLSHRSKRWLNEITYTEEPSSFDRDFYVGGQDLERFWLEKRLDWTSTLTMKRSSVSLTLTSLRRDRTEDDGQLSEDDQYGATIGYSRQLSQVSTLSGSFSFDKYSFDSSSSLSAQDDYYRRLNINWNRSFSNDLSVDCGVIISNQSSGDDELGYDENQVFVNLNKQF
ncbi:hypothetical protein K0504_11420 [Neiella marina]|uniref:TIGR03016 family PEP-CTERM system-associated outer membrane protein n=1 Tax=Neiella holothuriorum TaxID=2870530 RepID=A0ABS7EID2_9GAMM|nr:hypothetical protein [Neiella holothuriorum]MBW8191648.1 hypothetical protein [Neiella holothuriorum]